MGKLTGVCAVVEGLGVSAQSRITLCVGLAGVLACIVIAQLLDEELAEPPCT